MIRQSTRLALAALICAGIVPFTHAETWPVVVPEALLDDAAITLAIDDLNEAGGPMGLSFALTGESDAPGLRAIVVGDVPRWREGARITAPAHPEGFFIRTLRRGDAVRMYINGGSVLGHVYGLYWLWDRMQVEGGMPDINVERAPALEARLTSGESKAAMRTALRRGANWVHGGNMIDLVPWGVEPEAGDNVRNRQQFNELIDYAHSLHLKFLADGDEFTYHPGWLARLGVDLRPENPDFWEALQAKYRSLFQALPGLDGVVIRTGELTRVHGRYLAYDVMHEPEDSPWDLAQRYRTFVQKLHEVVVGEYGKLYFHRTWVTNTTEQHSDPEVFRAIFTEAVPTENLYLSPYITKADRWLYQPVNPTFNQTPHHMVALLSALEYHGHQGVDVFPTYPGPYFCSAMHAIRGTEPDNLRGVHFGGPAGPGWSTWHVTPYTAFRLAWNPAERPETIAHDIAAMAFGPDAAEAVGTLLMQSQEAYTRGLYVKPVAESISGNTLPHLRLTTFPVQGFPAIDKGKAHIDWLRTTIYEPSLGRIDEAVAELDAGLALAETMHAQGVAARGLIHDEAEGEALVDSLTLMRALIRATGGYIKLAYAYFGYWDEPSPETHALLAQRFEALEDAVDDFKAAPGYQYKLFGIDALMANARALLDDRAQAQAALARALDGPAIETAVAQQQAAHAAMLEARAGDAVPVLRWEGRVDGKEIFHIAGADLTIEHIAADPIHSESVEWVNPLPQTPVTVLVRTRQARDMGPFVLEQPTAANGYTAKLYLFDTPGGYGLWNFEVYYLSEPPDALGLAIPWQDE